MFIPAIMLPSVQTTDRRLCAYIYISFADANDSDKRDFFLLFIFEIKMMIIWYYKI